jgi:hypothetical protein
VRPDWDARRAFYRGDLARRAFAEMRATSRLVIEGEALSFGAVLTFFESESEAAAAEERLAAMRSSVPGRTIRRRPFRASRRRSSRAFAPLMRPRRSCTSRARRRGMRGPRRRSSDVEPSYTSTAATRCLNLDSRFRRFVGEGSHGFQLS